uniref:Uncharacterized protein n=1 Tax=Oryza rufipogon TaxID=4529 RepID=A0A0E0Q8W5_ORYRU
MKTSGAPPLPPATVHAQRRGCGGDGRTEEEWAERGLYGPWGWGRLLSWEEEEEKNVVSSSSLRSPAFLLRVLLLERRFFSFGYDIMKDDIGTSYGDLPDHKYFISVREFTTSAMEYIDSTRCSLLGEYKKLNVWIVKERIKCCVRSMAVELFNQHEEGYCLSRFGESNIWVAPTGHIRFRLVTKDG